MALTPMMQQYFEVKEKCKDCILFFRLGDFYEMFFEDAQTASKELELVLTGRDCGLEERAPMCGIPFHAANNYISRLVGKGFKVAICEQLEDPSVAKGIVKRDIIKIITPGTYTDTSFLEETKNHYIMSVYLEKNQMGLCFADISTGELMVTDSTYNLTLLLDEISKFQPKELIYEESLSPEILKEIRERFDITYSSFPKHFFLENAEDQLKKHFLNFEDGAFTRVLLNATSGLLQYLLQTQKTSLSHMNKMEQYNIVEYLTIDMNSRRNLELTETLREKSKKGSLLWVLDKTNTAMGARQLRKWVERPLLNHKAIEGRLNAVEELLSALSTVEDLKEALRKIYDIERLVGKISVKSVNGKELIALKLSIEKIPEIKKALKNFHSDLLQNIYAEIDDLSDIHEMIDKAILESPPISIKEGNLIKDGYNPIIDELRAAKAHGKEWIAALENSEREVTGIKSLKVGYNKVFGYYIEITKANLSSIPEGRYIRKQTLANAERYITPELKEMEDKILGAEDKLIQLEYELFVDLREQIESHVDRMKIVAKNIAKIDCLSAFATVALENQYCKPTINSKGTIAIQGGRHPVIEQMIPTGSFVANNTDLNTKEQKLLLITGPNMAGKSTYMRQVALITILAQIGSFVPATSANLSLCDKVFTRIGASDDLAAGKSTFMVEMWEVSNILQNATNKSLVLLDEVGRGTSTYDGLSIAWAVIEYICQTSTLQCKTLFATHYHELTDLEGKIDGIVNYSVAVKEMGNDIVFLRKIVKGSADDSYGIEVAKLAGLPKEVITRAKEILLKLEGKKNQSISKSKAIETKPTVPAQKEILQMDIAGLQKDDFVKKIADIDIANLTPMDSFAKLYDLIKKAKEL